MVQYVDKDNELHNDSGPALITPSGAFYYYHGKLHRLDGPAVEYSHGSVAYWIAGIKYSRTDYNEKIKQLKKVLK